MANMGTTGTVNVTKQMMSDAAQAISDYQETINGLNTELKMEIDGLIPSSFSGSAANGYKTFYQKSVEPNITDGLKGMLTSLTNICDSVKAQIPGEEQGVDDQLGQGNQNPGGQVQ